MAVGLTLVILGLAAYRLVATATSPWGHGLIASDLVKGYLVAAQRFLDTGSPYTTDQLAGPWQLGFHSFIHPPSSLVLIVPFLWLPLFLWWVVPVGLTAWALARIRPAPWAWPLMAACLLWPRSTGALLAGNTDMWAMAFVAAGVIWGWPVIGLAAKPTFALVAIVTARRRSTWIAAAGVLGLILLTLPLWLEWLAVIGNADLSPTYSVLNLPLVLLPLVAYAARPRSMISRPPSPPRVA